MARMSFRSPVLPLALLAASLARPAVAFADQQDPKGDARLTLVAEDGAILESHVVVGRRCRVAAGAWLHPHVVLYDGVAVGPGAEVHSGAVLGADGFGYAAGPAGLRKVPQVGGVEVGAGA